MGMSYGRALVTGGAGFIGSHIVEALVSAGCEVRVLDNLSTGRLSNLASVQARIRFCRGDIRDRKRLAGQMDGCDVVFHEAAVVSVPLSVEDPVESAGVNEEGTLYVLEAARAHQVRRVVLASSCAVYGNDPQLPKHETMPPAPESPYAVQKRAGELYAGLYPKLYGLETVCLRYFNVYGPRQDPASLYSGVISVFMAKAFLDEPPIIFGDGTQSRDFVFVRDVVRANLLAAEAKGASGGIFNVGTGVGVGINSLWQAVRRISGCRREPDYAPARPGDVVASVAGIDHAAATLGFRARYALEQGLETTYGWCRANLGTHDGPPFPSSTEHGLT